MVDKFRKENPSKYPWYSAKAHYLTTTCLSFPLIIYAFMKIENITALDLLVVPILIIFAMLFEYIVHRYLLHHRQWFLKEAYVEHTLRHHAYFNHEAIEVTKSADFERVLFPVWGVAIIQYGIMLPSSLAIGYLFSPNAGYLSLIVGAMFFFMYETIHMITHLPLQHWIYNVPGLFYLREHHRAHHHPAKMGKYNFNIVFPLWDILLGTRIVLPVEDRPTDDKELSL